MNPLDQLRDLHLPPPPGYWPLAPGWWLLLTAIVLGTGFAIYFFRKYRRRNTYRRVATERATTLLTADNGTLLDALQLVRQTALSANPDTTLAALPGPDLISKLDAFSNGKLLLALTGEISSETSSATSSEKAIEARLYSANYPPLSAEQSDALRTLICHWIRKHRQEDLC